MNAEHLRLLREHFRNPYPFWVDERDEDGRFPAAPSPDAIPIPVMIRGRIVVTMELGCVINDVPITQAQYVAYLPDNKNCSEIAA